jgi:hypothetical protein
LVDVGQLAPSRAVIRVTYEHLQLQGDEGMGLVGGNYLLEVRPWLNAGIAVYGAVEGERGGFLTGGIETALKMPIARGFSTEAGIFLGGGGGGGAPQGGGFMIRPHLDILFDTGHGTIGAGISHINFPNGDVDSTQATVIYQIPITALFAGGWVERSNFDRDMATLQPLRDTIGTTRHYRLTYQALFPSGGTRDTEGKTADSTIGLIGAELHQSLTRQSYFRLAAAGAATGNADGYAQLLAGWGLTVDLGNHGNLTVGLAAGAGGGGKVDTGGGFLAELEAGVNYWFADQWSLGLSGGYLAAPDGDFHAGRVGASLTYGPRPSSAEEPSISVPGRWRVRGGFQTYLATGTIRKPERSDDDSVELLAVKIDRMIGPSLYITGQALAAIEGDAGGYAVGLVGVGWTQPLGTEEKFFVNAELTAGTGGGGGIDSGGGFLVQAMGGIGWNVTRQVALLASAGGVAAPEGRLAAPTADISLVWRFTTAETP